MFRLFQRKDPQIPLLENVLTPLEIVSLTDNGRFKPSDFQVSSLLRNAAPKAFRREVLTEGATFYPSGVASDRLLICFSDIAGHLMMPISVLLQLTDEATHVLLLSDPGRSHYTHSVSGVGRDFGDLVNWLRAFAGERGYGTVMTFGTSLGGYAALRAGRVLGCRRAVSISGLFPFHPSRLKRRSRPVEPFDPLCACTPSRIETVALHSADNIRDAGFGDQLAVIDPAVQIVAMPGDNHNIVHELFKRDRLGHLVKHLFDTTSPCDPAYLTSLMAQRPLRRN